MSFLRHLFDSGGGQSSRSPDQRSSRARSEAIPIAGNDEHRPRSVSVGSAPETSRGGLLRLLSSASSSQTLPPLSSSSGADDSSHPSFFRRLSLGDSVHAGSSSSSSSSRVVQAGLREEIIQSLNGVMSQLAVLTAESLEALRRKEPEADLTHLHTGIKTKVPDDVVESLCLAIEQACFHCLRVMDFHYMVSFFDLVEAVVTAGEATASSSGGGKLGSSSSSKREETASAASVVAMLKPLLDKVRSNSYVLRTPVGLARSFLRHALNAGKLEEALSALTSRTGELRSYYESEALLLHGDSVALLLTSLASLEHYELVVEADDECLDTAPKWPLIRFPSPPPDMTPSTSCDGVVLGAELVKAVEKFKLDDDMESGTIERFKRDDSFNSSAKSLSRRDRLLDSLLLRSGGNLRHFLGASGSEDLGDDVAVSVPRCNYLFPPGCKRRRDGDRLLGQSVVSLVRDPYTCRMAVLEPGLGVPFIFEELFAFLRGRLDVPQLFTSKVSTWRWSSSLTKSLQDYQEVPPESDPYVVASTLLHLLRSLPEPLLTFERYHAFLACARPPTASSSSSASSSSASSSSSSSASSSATSSSSSSPSQGGEPPHPAPSTLLLRELVNELPSEHKPTLRHLVHMLHALCCGGSNGKKGSRPPAAGDLSAHDAASIFCRGVLRSYVPDLKPGGDPPAAAVDVVQQLIENYEYVFADVAADAHERQAALVGRMRQVRAQAAKCSKALDETDPHCLHLLEELYRFLARVERRRQGIYRVSALSQYTMVADHGCAMPTPTTGSSSDDHYQHAAAPPTSPAANSVASDGGSDDDEDEDGEGPHYDPIRADPLDEDEFTLDGVRWETCGFVRGNVGCELGSHSLLALECMVYFTKRFPNVAAEMIFQYANRGRRGKTVSFEAVCAQVLHVVLQLLRLLPMTSSSSSEELDISTFADAGFWPLFEEPHVVEEAFCASLSLLDFLHYHEVIPLSVMEAHLLEVKRQLSWALSLGPQSLQAMWELWLAIRLELKLRQEAASSHDSPAGVPVRVDEGDEEEEDDELAMSVCSFEGDMGGDSDVAFKISRGIRTRILGHSDILKPWMVTILEPALPERCQNYDWAQLYSLKRHGASIKTLFTRGRRHSKTLLLVLDTTGTVMGGFATDTWRDNKDRYYGSGECFLFTFKGGRFVKYTWTRANSYFMLSSTSGLAMGGGGHFGLYLDADLAKGSSDHCKTYGSHCLAHSKAFDVVAVELWGFRTPMSGDLDLSSHSQGDRKKGLVEALEEMNINGTDRSFCN